MKVGVIGTGTMGRTMYESIQSLKRLRRSMPLTLTESR